MNRNLLISVNLKCIESFQQLQRGGVETVTFTGSEATNIAIGALVVEAMMEKVMQLFLNDIQNLSSGELSNEKAPHLFFANIMMLDGLTRKISENHNYLLAVKISRDINAKITGVIALLRELHKIFVTLCDQELSCLSAVTDWSELINVYKIAEKPLIQDSISAKSEGANEGPVPSANVKTESSGSEVIGYQQGMRFGLLSSSSAECFDDQKQIHGPQA